VVIGADGSNLALGLLAKRTGCLQVQSRMATVENRVLATLAILSPKTEAQCPYIVHDGANLRAQLFPRHIETNGLVTARISKPHLTD
jgi:hypothetical protein